MCGAEIVVKSDGVLAVEAFCSAAPGSYDAILMDIQMPEMDGYASAPLEAGMDAHTAKPLDIGILCSTLGKLRGK